MQSRQNGNSRVRPCIRSCRATELVQPMVVHTGTAYILCGFPLGRIVDMELTEVVMIYGDRGSEAQTANSNAKKAVITNKHLTSRSDVGNVADVQVLCSRRLAEPEPVGLRDLLRSASPSPSDSVRCLRRSASICTDGHAQRLAKTRFGVDYCGVRKTRPRVHHQHNAKR